MQRIVARQRQSSAGGISKTATSSPAPHPAPSWRRPSGSASSMLDEPPGLLALLRMKYLARVLSARLDAVAWRALAQRRPPRADSPHQKCPARATASLALVTGFAWRGASHSGPSSPRLPQRPGGSRAHLLVRSSSPDGRSPRVGARPQRLQRSTGADPSSTPSTTSTSPTDTPAEDSATRIEQPQQLIKAVQPLDRQQDTVEPAATQDTYLLSHEGGPSSTLRSKKVRLSGHGVVAGYAVEGERATMVDPLGGLPDDDAGGTPSRPGRG